jgi:hypothetical protein
VEGELIYRTKGRIYWSQTGCILVTEDIGIDTPRMGYTSYASPGWQPVESETISWHWKNLPRYSVTSIIQFCLLNRTVQGYINKKHTIQGCVKMRDGPERHVSCYMK